LAVLEPEPERVEEAPLHLHWQARAAVWILQRQVHGRPLLLAPQLGHLTLDPDSRQAVEPRGDPLVEGTHREDLAAVDERAFTLCAYSRISAAVSWEQPARTSSTA